MLILSAINGAIAFFIWKVSMERLKKLNPDLIYLTLRIVCLFFVVPVAYVVLQLTDRNGYLQVDGPWQMNFALAGIPAYAAAAVAVLWIVSAAFLIVRKLIGSKDYREMLKGTIPEDDDVAMEEFVRIKKKLGIRRRIRLNRNDLLASPMIVGYIFPKVLLPYKKYNREQLQVIFYHELTHFKSRDVLYKICSYYISLYDCLLKKKDGPVKYVNEWSEYDCDTKAMYAMRDEIGQNRYFQVILEIMEKSMNPREEDHIFSMLYENSSNLGRRVLYMDYCRKMKKVNKGVSFLLVLAFVMVSMTTTYAAGLKIADVQEILYKETEVLTEEARNEDVLEEIYLSAEEDDTYTDTVYENSEENIMPILEANDIVGFDWSIDPNIRHVSSQYSLRSGNNVSISCTAAPSSNTYWIGIMDSSGNVRYVSGSGSVSHTFEIKKSDKYRVIVQNVSSSKITASGNYYYY